MNLTNETLLFDRFLIVYNLCVFTCIILIFVFHCTHVRMSCIKLLLTYLHQNELFRLYVYCITNPQFHHSNSFLLLYTVAPVYSIQETITVVELWAFNPL